MKLGDERHDIETLALDEKFGQTAGERWIER
jgi:hypothetical protein